MGLQWHLSGDRAAFQASIVAAVEQVIVEGIAARGRAVLAISGGKTPIPVLEALASRELPWRHVIILPTDDRIVPLDDPLSNAGMLRRVFGHTAADVLPLVTEVLERHDAGRRADALLQDLSWPLDLVWLGMGGDGHTASIFVGPDLETALRPAGQARAVGVRPDPLPPEAPVDRVTLTAPAIAEARRCFVVIEGAAKRARLAEAVASLAESADPVGQVLARRTADTRVYALR